MRAEMPPGTWCIRVKDKVYCYHQPGRGSKYPGERVRVPYTPDDPRFWTWHAERGLWGVPEAGTFEAAAEAWLTSPTFARLADETQANYRRYAEALIDRWGARSIGAITRTDVLEWRRTMEDRPPTANYAIKIARTFWKWAINAGFAVDHPFENIEPYEHESKQATPWPDWAFELVEQHGDWRMRAFVALGRYTGLRTKDIVRLHLKHFETGELRVTISKKRHRREHVIPLHPALDPVLAEARRQGSLYLFPQRNGEPITTQVFRLWFWRRLQQGPLKPLSEAGLSPHGLRVLAVNTLLELGCTTAEVAAITDQSLQVVEHYARQRDQAKLARRAMAKWAKSAEGTDQE